MGYTHEIRFEKQTELFKLWVKCSFPTTADAVAIHVKGLNKNKTVRNVEVVEK